MSEHPLVFEPGAGLTVRWYTWPNGVLVAAEYADECRVRGKLVARLRTLAENGSIRLWELGHRLHGDFRDLWVIKMGDHRFLYFLHCETVYVVSGVKKAPPKVQDRDYQRALDERTRFLKS